MCWVCVCKEDGCVRKCAHQCVTLIFLVSLESLRFSDLTTFSHLLLFSPPSPSSSVSLLLPHRPPTSSLFSPPHLLLWGFSGCIFPVFLNPVQCNFLFINIWFPPSELSSAECAARETETRVKKMQKIKSYLASPSCFLFISSQLPSLSIFLTPSKSPNVAPTACFTVPKQWLIDSHPILSSSLTVAMPDRLLRLAQPFFNDSTC